jgi:WD40 repeat protein
LTGCEDGRARIWDVATGKLLGSALDDSGPLQAAAYSPDGRTIVTCSDRVHFWDAGTLNHAGSPLLPQTSGKVMSLAFHPDGGILLTGGTDMTAQQWDLTSQRALGLRLEHQASVISTAYSPDGQIIATGGHDGLARLWDAATGRPVGPSLAHRGSVEALAFSPDGRTLGTASWDTTVRLWSLPAPMESPPDMVSQWAQVLTGLKLDADGVVRVLDAETWQLGASRLHRVDGYDSP